jgi:hypothetical protein
MAKLKISEVEEDKCESARGPDADRHVRLLIQFAVEGSLSGLFTPH